MTSTEPAYLKPQLMKTAVLTAAVQDVVPRDEQIADPIAAALKSTSIWVDAARRGGFGLQLSTALTLRTSHVPAEAMLDPVAAHGAFETRTGTDGDDLSDANAADIIALCGGDVKIYDLGYFDNLLHEDDDIRAKIQAHTLRCGRAALKLKAVGCDGVTGFIGRNPNADLDQNVVLFEKYVIPLLRQFKEMGLTFYLEQCPMPGWNTRSLFVNNIGHVPGMWIKLVRICEKHGVEDAFRITYDPSHDILMGSRPEMSFVAMRAAGLEKYVARFHSKGQFIDPTAVALWSLRGQDIDLGCRIDGEPHPDASKQGGAWGVMPCAHGMPGLELYDPLAVLTGKRVNWVGMHLAARQVLGMDTANAVNVLEHEFGPARKQNLPMVWRMLLISKQFIEAVDAQADALYRAQAWAAEYGITLPGADDPAGDYQRLVAAARAIRA
jgi:sugar phosphate isomerase/epimerase